MFCFNKYLFIVIWVVGVFLSIGDIVVSKIKCFYVVYIFIGEREDLGVDIGS